MRVELTTELAAYWRVLEEHRPKRARELVAEFAGGGSPPICCMVQRTNTLDALMGLAVAAARPRVVIENGRERCLTADECVPLLSGCAEAGRASDPVLVERLGRLAFERRVIAFDDPLGVYLTGVEHARLRTPDGDAVPAEWFTFSRGVEPRFQRMTIEVPRGAGFVVDDLVDVATEQRIRHGGQIAELVQVAVFLGVSDPGRAEEPSIVI